jgi:hypothetical protein
MPLDGEFGNLCHHSIRRMLGDRNLLSLNASLAISMRVLRFEVSGPRRRTMVRPVLLTGQTGLELLQLRLWFFGLSFVNQPKPYGFLVNHWKPRELAVDSANHHS